VSDSRAERELEIDRSTMCNQVAAGTDVRCERPKGHEGKHETHLWTAGSNPVFTWDATGIWSELRGEHFP
jgi:hypothetical protein